MRLLLGLVCILFGTATMAQVPNTFQSGQPAVAAEVNENFTNLDTRATTNAANITNNAAAIGSTLNAVVIQQVLASDASGVAGALCPAISLVVSAQCDCNGTTGVHNFGVLFACQVSGNGGVAGCFNESFTFNPVLLGAPANITLVCLSGLRIDGTEILPVILSNGVQPFSLKPGRSEIDASGAEYETALNNARNAVSAHNNVLQNR